jgi:hypothetical protein
MKKEAEAEVCCEERSLLTSPVERRERIGERRERRKKRGWRRRGE